MTLVNIIDAVIIFYPIQPFLCRIIILRRVKWQISKINSFSPQGDYLHCYEANKLSENIYGLALWHREYY